MTRKATSKLTKEITDHIREIKIQIDEAETQLIELVKMKIKFSAPGAINTTFDKTIREQQNIVVSNVNNLIALPSIVLVKPPPAPPSAPPSAQPPSSPNTK